MVLLAAILSSGGCIYLVVGGIGALGGYVVSPDTVEGVSENEGHSYLSWMISCNSFKIGNLSKNNDDTFRIMAVLP